MAQRKRLGTNSSMATEPHASAPCSCPAPYPNPEHPEEEYEDHGEPEESQHSYHNQEEADLTDRYLFLISSVLPDTVLYSLRSTPGIVKDSTEETRQPPSV